MDELGLTIPLAKNEDGDTDWMRIRAADIDLDRCSHLPFICEWTATFSMTVGYQMHKGYQLGAHPYFQVKGRDRRRFRAPSVNIRLFS